MSLVSLPRRYCGCVFWASQAPGAGRPDRLGELAGVLNRSKRGILSKKGRNTEKKGKTIYRNSAKKRSVAGEISATVCKHAEHLPKLCKSMRTSAQFFSAASGLQMFFHFSLAGRAGCAAQTNLKMQLARVNGGAESGEKCSDA